MNLTIRQAFLQTFRFCARSLMHRFASCRRMIHASQIEGALKNGLRGGQPADRGMGRIWLPKLSSLRLFPQKASLRKRRRSLSAVAAGANAKHSTGRTSGQD